MIAAPTVRPHASATERVRRWRIAVLLYLALTAAYAIMLPARLWQTHTPYNHYALQAEAWLNGSLSLAGAPPSYTGNNDFALYEGRHYISFPPVPAALISPAVALNGGAGAVADARFFLWFSALGPALLFLTLEALRRAGRVLLGQRSNALLAAAFGLGTVYWFSAVQGTVWFAGHVVGVAALCGYLRFSVGARFPALAGLALALAVGTRPSLVLALPFFLHELWRARQQTAHGSSSTSSMRQALSFAATLGMVGLLLMAHNWARFDDPFEFGHRYLTVAWRTRIERWGLFSFHYLGRNLAVMLTGLPFQGANGLQVNGHGLALWLTTPIYLWALWPRRTSSSYWVCAASAAAMALLVLLYQNSGWLQFGYRFSNDFGPLLFLMIALGWTRLRRGFWLLAAWGVAINGFGALTFGKSAYRDFYHLDGSQRIIHQPD